MNNGPKEQESTTYTAPKWVIFGGFVGVKVLGVPPSQPLVNIMIGQQAQVRKGAPLNVWQMGKLIYNTQGAKGFVNATRVGMTREAWKAFYKGPLQVGANDFAMSSISADSYGSHFYRGAVAGGIVGVLDATIASPVERYKIFKVLNPETNILKFLGEIYQQQQGGFAAKSTGFVSELNRGWGATIGKQSVMNIAFFTAREWTTYTAKPYKNDNPGMTRAFETLFPPIAAGLAGAPLNVIKTIIQQQNKGEKKKIKELFSTVMKKSGWRGLIAGTPASIVLVGWGYTFNNLFLRFFEEHRSGKSSKLPRDQSESNKSLEELAKALGQLSIDPSSATDAPPKSPLLLSEEAKGLPQGLVPKENASLQQPEAHKIERLGPRPGQRLG